MGDLTPFPSSDEIARAERLTREHFVYEGETNRAVAVHTAAMTEALRKLYGAGSLADELEAGAR